MIPYDCAIIGAGPAGLAAATYLGRFRRSVIVIDDDLSRAKLIPKTHNTPGFPGGVAGKTLLKRQRDQAAHYDVAFISGSTAIAERASDGFRLTAGGAPLLARKLLIATGVANIAPEFDGHDKALATGLLRYCPICDAHEVIGKRVAVFGNCKRSAAEVDFLSTYCDDITLLAWNEESMRAMRDDGCAPRAVVKSVRAQGTELVVETSEGPMTFDSAYSCLGVRPRNELAQTLGAQLSEAGGIFVDKHQRTSVEGVYAAGDVVEALDQIAVAWGHAAVAATDIHNSLRA